MMQIERRNKIENLKKLKEELDALKEYQCGEHPTRILYFSQVQIKEMTKIEQQLRKYGSVKSISKEHVERYGILLAAYYDLRQARYAYKMLKDKYQISYALAKDVLNDSDQNQGTLVVFNIEYSITNENLKELFGRFGDIKEIRETPNKKHHKFIEYFDLRNAQKAMECLNHYELKGRKLKIEPSRPGGIRQRLLNTCINEMELSDSLVGLPPPNEMSKLIVKLMKEMEETPILKQKTHQYSSDIHRSIHANSRQINDSPNETKKQMNDYSFANSNFLNSSHFQNLHLTFNPSVNCNYLMNPSGMRYEGGTKEQSQKTTEETTQMMKSQQSPKKSISHPSTPNQTQRTFKESDIYIPPSIRSMQSSPTKIITQKTIHMEKPKREKMIEKKKKQQEEEESFKISVPKPTSIGQELSKQYEKEYIGTPHILCENKYDGFNQIEEKGIAFGDEEDIDEIKRVLIVENIPITFTYHELINKIENCISCFYDQFIIIQQDEFTYKCMVRVTNQMVVDSFKMCFDNIFLENDQDELCKVHEITCQGSNFTNALSSLLL